MTELSQTKQAIDMRRWLSNPENRQKHNARARQYRKENRKKHNSVVRNARLKASFGITIDQYNNLFDSQEGKCAICKNFQRGRCKNLCVDHDHETGNVRGLLCSACNKGIGMLMDDPKLLESAAAYIRKSNFKLLEDL